MKRNFTSDASISQGNVTEYQGYLKQQKIPPEYSALCMWFSELVDAIAGGDNMWLTLGANRKRDQMLLTLHDGDDVRYVAAGSFRELARLISETL